MLFDGSDEQARTRRCRVSSEERAERLLGQLHQWAMEAVELPRDRREAFVLEVADRYYEDALKNGLGGSRAEAWRDSITEWLRALVEVIETSGGAGGGHA
jgi:hypothetical protein